VGLGFFKTFKELLSDFGILSPIPNSRICQVGLVSNSVEQEIMIWDVKCEVV
jgi:hypothetical protein